MGGDTRVKPRAGGVSDPSSAPTLPAPSPGEWAISVGLFLLTLVSTLTAGALLQGTDPLSLQFRPVAGIPFWWPGGVDMVGLLQGAGFALPFLLILVVHEWAHRVMARRHGVRASLPYLIPFPPHVSVVGTLGGFIRLRSAIPHRRALLDIGLSGPVSSLLLSIPILAVGLLLSTPSDAPTRTGLPFIIFFADIPIRLGEPLLVKAVLWILPGVGGGDVALHLHPLAFAGWLGLMLTFLNLLPLARLDGGHILHALDPPRQRWWARATVVVFVTMGFIWVGWWLWAALMVVLGRSRSLPDAPSDPGPEPGPLRRGLAWTVMIGLLALLPPVPVSF
jgi:membrane-associated protease RseP (regulator of RpoE activity)